MTNWSGLRTLLADVQVERTFEWDELQAVVGDLPRSAYVHPAFWKGHRPGWPGFTTRNVEVGRRVTFVRRGQASPTRQTRVPHREEAPTAATDVAVVLIGCAKSKLPRAAAAKDLYVSPLFRKARNYAEATQAPWFIMSAEHGLVHPDALIAPYDLYLASTSSTYRHTWGTKVVRQLEAAVGSLNGKNIEVHAGSAYVDALRSQLHATGARLVEPLRGLRMGQRLAWYSEPASLANTPLTQNPVESTSQRVSRSSQVGRTAPELRSVDWDGSGRAMGLRDVSAAAVMEAIREFDAVGREAFLYKYGFGRAREYFVLWDNRLYDSKALLGAAHGFQFGEPLTSDEFSGGLSTTVAVLQSLGFTIVRDEHFRTVV